MKRILEGPSRRVGTIFQEVDANFIEVCNSILKIAFPECNLLDYAEIEPESPSLFDAYLVKEDSAVWETIVEKNQILYWDGNEWLLIPFKITEINEAIQFLYFDADKISITQIDGLTAFDVQGALSQITAALVTAGIIVPSTGIGSGIGSGSI